jgi:hypothetical protein
MEFYKICNKIKNNQIYIVDLINVDLNKSQLDLLVKALSNNISVINLSINNMFISIKSIFDVLQTNNTIQKLKIKFNSITDEENDSFLKMLTLNKSIYSLTFNMKYKLQIKDFFIFFPQSKKLHLLNTKK